VVRAASEHPRTVLGEVAARLAPPRVVGASQKAGLEDLQAAILRRPVSIRTEEATPELAERRAVATPSVAQRAGASRRAGHREMQERAAPVECPDAAAQPQRQRKERPARHPLLSALRASMTTAPDRAFERKQPAPRQSQK